jgi:hypothetical protein
MEKENKLTVDNGEFQRVLMKKHHKEMMEVIQGIKFPQPKDDSVLLKNIELTIKLLTAKLDLLQSPKITVEKTEVNQKDVIATLKDLITEVKALKAQEVKEVIVEKKEEKKEEKKVFTFTVHRDNNGYIQSVTAKQQ